MNPNFLRLLHPVILIADIALLVFLHDRLTPVLEDLLKNGDDEIAFGITGSEYTAGALVFVAFTCQFLSWYFLTESEHKLWRHPENLDAGRFIRFFGGCAILLIPLFEAGLTLKLLIGENTNAFSAVRQSSPTNWDMTINVGIAAMVAISSTFLAWLTAAAVALQVQRRDEEEVERLLNIDRSVEPAE